MRPYRQLYPWHSSSAKCTQPPSSKAGTSRHTGPWSWDGWEGPLKLIHCDPPAVSRDISSYIRLLRVLSNLTLNIPEAALRLAKESSEAGWRLVKSAVHTIFLGAFFFPFGNAGAGNLSKVPRHDCILSCYILLAIDIYCCDTIRDHGQSCKYTVAVLYYLRT